MPQDSTSLGTQPMDSQRKLSRRTALARLLSPMSARKKVIWKVSPGMAEPRAVYHPVPACPSYPVFASAGALFLYWKAPASSSEVMVSGLSFTKVMFPVYVSDVDQAMNRSLYSVL